MCWICQAVLISNGLSPKYTWTLFNSDSDFQRVKGSIQSDQQVLKFLACPETNIWNISWIVYKLTQEFHLPHSCRLWSRLLFPGAEVHLWGSFHLPVTFSSARHEGFGKSYHHCEAVNTTTQLEANIPFSEMQTYFFRHDLTRYY